MPTTKKTYENDKISIVDAIVKRAKLKHTSKWVKENQLKINLKEGGLVNIFFPKTMTGKFTIEVDAKAKVWLEKLEKKELQDIENSNIAKTVFKVSTDHIKTGTFTYLGKNIDVLNELDKYFKQMGISQVHYSKCDEVNTDQLSFDKLSIIFSPYDYAGMGATPRVQSSYFDKYKKLKGFNTPQFNGATLNPVKSEITKDVVLDDKKIGMYYEERNLVMLNFNPFHNLDLRNVESYTENEYLKVFLEDLKNAIIKSGAKTKNNERFKLKLLAHSFNKNVGSRIRELKTKIKECGTHIHSYESTLTEQYNMRIGFNKEISALSLVDGDSVDQFLNEIEKIKKQPLITNVSLENNKINITFKPTTVKAHLGRNVEGDGRKGPMVEMFVGQITAHIDGDGKILVSSSHPCGPNPHPHGNNDKRPCFGSGDGASAIHSLIAERKFSDFIYVFWMWIKKYRPEDCYVKPYILYDDRLKKGLPVFGPDGKRITINDPARLKSKEQVKLTEAAEYKKNIKKYKSFKL